MKYIASISFGKDSLAMLLRLIEENKPLDEVVFYDTGMEFQCIYKLRDKILDLSEFGSIKTTASFADDFLLSIDIFSNCFVVFEI